MAKKKLNPAKVTPSNKAAKENIASTNKLTPNEPLLDVDLQEGEFVVRGKVIDTNGKPLRNILVRAFDKDLRKKQLLGKATTDNAGHYSISYTFRKFLRAEKGHADLCVVVVNAKGKELVSSVVIFNAPAEAIIDLTLPPDGKTLSEFELLLETILPLLASQGKQGSDLKIAELEEKDLAFLSQETGQPLERIALLLAAAKATLATSSSSAVKVRSYVSTSQGPGIPVEAFYGWFRQGQPQEFTVLIQRSANDLMASLERAIKQNIIPALDAARLKQFPIVLQELKINQTLKPAHERDTASFGDIILSIGKEWIDKTRLQKLADIASNSVLDPDAEDFITSIKPIKLTPDEQKKLQQTLRLGKLTFNNPPLIGELHRFIENDSDASLHSLASIQPDQWIDLAYTHGNAPGSYIEPVSYASQMGNAVEERLPTASLINQISNKTIFNNRPGIEIITKALAENPQFNIVTDDVATFSKEADLDKDKQEFLQNLQNLKKVGATWSDTEVLINYGFTSMEKLADFAPYQLQNILGDDMEMDQINTIYTNVNSSQSIGIGLISYLQPLFSFTSDVMQSDDSLKELVDNYPTLRKLFGALEQCGCNPCLSVLSPAAYFADLLRYIDTNGMAGVILRSRRSDLYDLELSCENAEIVLPHIDLALEILENTVVFPKVISLLPGTDADQQFSKNQIGQEIRDALQKTSEETLGNLNAEKDKWSLRPRIKRAGVSFWIITDRFRRWVIESRKETFGTPLGIELSGGMDLKSIEIDRLKKWLNSDGDNLSIPLNFKKQFEQILINEDISGWIPSSIVSYNIQTLESGKHWKVTYQTSYKVTVVNNGNITESMLLESEDGIKKVSKHYNEKTINATTDLLNKGAIGGVLTTKKTKIKRGDIHKTTKGWSITLNHSIELIYNSAQLAIEGLTYQSTANDRDLLARAQNRNPLAYDILSATDAVFPWSLPYDQSLAEIRSLLNTAGNPRLKLIENNLSVNQLYINETWVREQLNISPGQEQLMITPKSGDNLWKAWGLVYEVNQYKVYDTFLNQEVFATSGLDLLKKVSILIQQARISFSDLQTLLQSDYVNPNQNITIQFDENCDPSKMVLSSDVKEDIFDRLHRFVRLWKILKWSIIDIDQALMAPGIGAGNLNSTAIVRLAQVIALQLKLNLPVQLAITFFDKFTNKSIITYSNGEVITNASIYNRIFQNIRLQNPPNPDFDYAKFEGTSQTNSKSLPELLPYIANCLGLRQPDLNLFLQSGIADFSDQSPTINLLQRIWRNIKLAKALQLSLTEYASACRLISQPDSPFISPAALVHFCDEVLFVKKYATGFTELENILHGNDPESILPKETAISILSDLQVQLQKTFQSNSFETGTEASNSVKKKLMDDVVKVLSQKLQIENNILSDLLIKKITGSSLSQLAIDYFIDNNFWVDSNIITSVNISGSTGYAILIKLQKTNLINNKWKADSMQLNWLRGPEQVDGYTGVILNELPVSTGSISYYDWKRSTMLFLIAQTSSDMEAMIDTYINTLGNGKTRVKIIDARWILAVTFGVTHNDVNVGAMNQGMDSESNPTTDPIAEDVPSQFDPLKLSGLLNYLTSLQKLGLSSAEYATLISEPTSVSSVLLAKQILNNKYTETFSEALQQVNNTLRMEQRDRLVDYLCWRSQLIDANALYEKYLIDVQMAPCMLTTRLLQSTAAAQLFVQRCLMNLEKNVSPYGFDRKRWEWTQNYRVWEANRKVFLYPENWLYPELRDDKTELFKEFEAHLTQNEPTFKNAHEGLKNYADGLVELSKIVVMGMHEYEAPSGNIYHSGQMLNQRRLFQIGRTLNSPYNYFWREAVNYSNGTRWMGWERINQDLSADHIVPFSYQGDLYIAWPNIVSRDDDSTKKTYLDVDLAWIRHTNKGWTEQKKSRDKISVEKEINRDVRSMLLFRAIESPVPEPIIELFLALPPEGDTFSPNTQPNLSVSGSWITGEIVITISIRTYKKYSRINTNTNVTSYRYEEAPLGELYVQRVFAFHQNENTREFVPGGDDNRSPAFPIWGLTLIKVKTSDNNFHQINFQAEKDGILNNKCELFFQQGKSYLLNWNIIYDCGPDPQPQILSPNDPVTVVRKGIFNLSGDADGEWISDENMNNKLNPPDNSMFYSSGLIETSNGISPINLYKDDNQFIEVGPSASGRFFCIRASKSSSLINSPGRLWQIEEGSNKLLISVSSPLGSTLPVSLAGFTEAKKVKSNTSVDLQNMFNLQKSSTFISESFGLDQLPVYNINNSHPLTIIQDLLPFNLSMPNALYNWEVFYHLPILSANFLSHQNRFSEARQWFHFIFDPTTNDESTGRERFWNFLPFRNENVPDSITKLLNTLANPDSPDSEKQKVQDQIGAWLADPFNPFAVARLRISAFEWFTVNSYIKNLIAWGDQLFRRDTRESISEATLLYILASNILGRRQEPIGSKQTGTMPLSYRSLGTLDDFSNRWIALSDTPFGQSFINPVVTISLLKHLSSIGSTYFCVPPNEKLPEMWDTVADRLYKIRNCQNFDGVQRNLSLLDPPIDPELLIRARAAGISIEDAISDLYAPPAIYRFTITIQKAIELCNEVKSLGGALLSAIEKKDAEHLSLLRSSQEIEMLKLVEWVRKEQINEASANIAALSKTRENIVSKIVYLLRQIGNNELSLDANGVPVIEDSYITQVQQSIDPAASMFSGLGLINSEVDQILWLQTNDILNIIGGISHAASGAAHIMAAGFGGEPSGVPYRISTGFGLGFSSLGTLFNTLASHYAMLEKRSGQMAGWQRRRDEWVYQAKTAVAEIQQMDKQIAASQIRKAISEKELENHRKQIEHNQNLDDYVRNQKFSKETLYTWMETQLSTVYFMAYQLAYEQAKKAEKAFKFELGKTISNYVQPGHWDNLKKGLLAGEGLTQDLRRMEADYLQNNTREFELTKHISLAMLSPIDLLKLKATGSCTFSIPEEIFDLDYPGHYFRRIKSVSITIPCITGPYTTVNCTLRLSNNTIRANASGTTYLPTDVSDTRFFTNKIPFAQIATSSAQNDSGVFELSFRDERYLPFEGAGVISDWIFELNGKYKDGGSVIDLSTFDFNSISDIIMHIKYTAREAGSLKKPAVDNLNIFINKESEKGPFFRLFSLKHDFPITFQKLLKGQASEFEIKRNHFPWFFVNRPITTSFVETKILKKNGLLEDSANLIDFQLNTEELSHTVQISTILNPVKDYDLIIILKYHSS